MTAPSSVDEAFRWLRFARENLKVAETVAMSGEPAPRIACDHAQQCVEKALKSILIYARSSVPAGEDLDEIRELIPPGWFVSIAFSDLSTLTELGGAGRYPGEWPEPTDQDARDAADQARDVWETVLDDLDRHGLDVSAFR